MNYLHQSLQTENASTIEIVLLVLRRHLKFFWMDKGLIEEQLSSCG